MNVVYIVFAIAFGILLFRPMRNCRFIKALALMVGFIISVAFALR